MNTIYNEKELKEFIRFNNVSLLAIIERRVKMHKVVHIVEGGW